MILHLPNVWNFRFLHEIQIYNGNFFVFLKPKSVFLRIDKKQADGIWTMDEIILMRKLKRKDEWALGKIIDLYSPCLEEIGVHQYYLMAHSISGLYSLYYANIYPEEVCGFIGIDSSVPKQNENEPFDTTKLNLLMDYLSKVKNALGVSRLLSVGNPEKVIYADQNYSYSQEDLEVFRILSLDTSYNKTIMNELKQIEKNLKIVRDMKFPEEVPVLNFVSEDNCEIFPEWEKLHRIVMGNNQENKLILLKGGHYLHFEQKERIISSVYGFVG